MGQFEPFQGAPIGRSGDGTRSFLEFLCVGWAGTAFAPFLLEVSRESDREEFMGIIRSNPTHDESGFTVLELAVVVLIVGVITSMSVVMFAGGKARYQLRQKAEKISWQIERARSLAVKYNQTLTVGFTSHNSVFGITCASCLPLSELPPFKVPVDIALSAYPTLTIKGNGTITASNGTIVVSDAAGRQVPITIANSGRTTVGDVSEGDKAN